MRMKSCTITVYKSPVCVYTTAGHVIVMCFCRILTPEDQEKRLSVSLWTKEKTKLV